MSTTHTVVGSPLGDLTLVADDGSLTGLYFPSSLVPARPGQLRPPGRHRVRRRHPPARRVFRRGADRVRPAARPARRWVPATGLETDQPHPVRADHQLRRPGPAARRRRAGQGRRPGGRPQPAVGDRALPPGRRQGRPAHRLRGRPGPETVPARPGAAGRPALVITKLPFEAIVSQHGPMVLRVCRAVLGWADADDAWSETFLAALRAYPDLPADANVEAWLVTIAHRKAIDVTRATARRAVPVADLPEHPAADQAGPADLDLRRRPGRPAAQAAGSGRLPLPGRPALPARSPRSSAAAPRPPAGPHPTASPSCATATPKRENFNERQYHPAAARPARCVPGQWNPPGCAA